MKRGVVKIFIEGAIRERKTAKPYMMTSLFGIILSAVETTLITVMGRERMLKNIIEKMKNKYDYILIDCMPSLGMITVNALAAADSVLIPVQSAYLSVKGVQELMKTIGLVKMRINHKLAIKNQWLDEEGRTYICYSIAEIMEDTGCKKSMVNKCLNELREVGLIETVQRGLGRTNIIYVKNFELVEEETADSRSLEIESPEVQKSNFKKAENQTSRSSKNKSLEVQISDSNNTKENNIYINNTNPILSIPEESDEMDVMEEYQAYSEIIKENIEYDALVERHPYEKEIIDGIFDLILETVITKKETVLVSGQEYPTALVKSKFFKLNYSHIEYVMDCMGKNTTKIHNIKGYLMTALFNAGSTIGSYYKAMVNYDMPQFAG